MEKLEKKLNIPFTEKLKSIPEALGIRVNEEPAYQILKEDKEFEIRRYPNQILAKVTIREVCFEEFREVAFKKLAVFMFGGNTYKENIGMTSPVLEAQAEIEKKTAEVPMTSVSLKDQNGSQEWTMSFILPTKYNMQNVPKPLDEDVVLEEVNGYDVATTRYNGKNSLERINEHEVQLNQWLKTQPQVEKIGKFFAAQYDAAFVVPFLKRNEVQVKVARPQQ